jgi:hypothetical protein
LGRAVRQHPRPWETLGKQESPVNTVHAPRPRVKPPLTARLNLPPSPAGPGLLALAHGKAEANHYYLWPLSSDYGTAWRVEKYATEGDEVYDVSLTPDGDTCECLGFLRWGHCKHTAGLRALTEAGLLGRGA